MSFDISAKSRRCDHLQILERYTIDALDFRTLHLASQPSINMRAPINGVSMVRLYLKGVLVHPEDPLYGYNLVPDTSQELSIQGRNFPFLKIVFDQPVRTLKSLVEVTYFTRQEFCLKCGGTGFVADWGVSPSGSLHHTTGVKKLAQQALKYVLTSRNPFSPNLVCPVRSYVGQKFNLGITEQDISAAITTALASYQAIQRAQRTVQTMDPTEMIKDVVSVETRQDPTDPTKVFVAIVLSCYGSTQTIPVNVALQTT